MAAVEGAAAVEGTVAEGPEAATDVPPPDEAVTPASNETDEATEAGPAAATEGAGPPDA